MKKIAVSLLILSSVLFTGCVPGLAGMGGVIGGIIGGGIGSGGIGGTGGNTGGTGENGTADN